METNIKKCCPNCSQFYQLKSLTLKQRGNIPLLLACGHTMCENCIKNIVKFLEPIECKVCHRDMEVNANDVNLLTQQKIKLYELFPVNIYMLGELTLEFFEESNQKKTSLEEDYYIDLEGLLKSIDNTQGKCLECHNVCTKMCQQCAIVLCDTCFNKTHKNFIIFKNHVLVNIAPLTDQNLCKVHKLKTLDYYCKDCIKAVCMDCMMVGGEKSCKNHNVLSMQEANANFIEELHEVSPKVDETYKRLTKTAVDIGNLLHNINNNTGAPNDLTVLMANIEQHFSKLTAQIQKHKQEVTSIITKLKSSEKDSLCKAKTDVAAAIKKSKTVLNTINLISNPNKLKQINLAGLLEKVNEIIDTPWHLNKNETNQNLPKVAVNEDLCALITDYIHLEGNAQFVYKLCSTSELGDVEIPPPPTAPVYPPQLPKDVRQQNKTNPNIESKVTANTTAGFYKNAPKYRIKSGSVSSINSCDSDQSYRNYTQGETLYQRPVVQPVPPFEESQHPKQLQEGSQELIFISHIIDPHNFFVQRSCHQKLVKDMIREFRNATSIPKPSVKHVAEGKVFLVFNTADNMWQRCRVISIDRRHKDKLLFHVFCVDFGSTEVVTIDKLRLLSPARLQSPYPLAINCSLANCVPKTGSWTSDDAIFIQNIIDNKQAVINIRHIRSTSNYTVQLECDVTTFEDGVSIAHALVFHERAKMPNPKLQYPVIAGIMEKPKIFMSNNDYKPKSVEEVYITEIVSPDKFFVRKRHLQMVYEKLSEDLEQDYSVTVSSGSIYLPENGMVCAVNTEKYLSADSELRTWARGLVTELPGRGRVRVFLYDTGALLLVHWTALRHLQTKFTTLRALATECYLAGVTPLNKKWSVASVALLRQYSGRVLRLTVDEARNRGAVSVTLHDSDNDGNDICLNQEMLRYKFAVSIGPYKFNKGEIEEQVFTNRTPIDEPETPCAPKKGQVLTKQTSVKNNIKEDNLDAKDKGPLRLEAKVLHYQSPSLLYMSLVHQQKAFNDLYERIQNYYSTKKAHGKNEWHAGDRCCTFCIQSQTWRRAVIVDITKENAKVFYTDFACIETVPLSGLKDLVQKSEDFSKIGDAAIKCHLCGVIPAVGEEWPSLTKEFLKELLDAYRRVFITKLGNFKDKSMPVEIWVYHTIQGGALEPNKSEWRCLNRKIIEQGLGVPDKSQQATSNENTDLDDDTLSFFNVTGSVQEWLQLEPIPTKPLISQLDSGSGSPSYDHCDESSEDIVGAVQSSNTLFISDWLPPESFANTEFTGIPTYIDNDGAIYLHDISQQDTLDLIRKALEVRFKKPDPKAKYAKWTVGEPCIAMFFLDNCFYRGRVIEVNEEAANCLIHYIDYGNDELCSFENLRKSIALYQIPIQAHKCVLDRIRPVGKQWDRQALDYIHKSIVEKKCFVKIIGDKFGEFIRIDLKYDKLCINDHLVDFEMAVYTDGGKAPVRKYVPLAASKQDDEGSVVVGSDSGPDYIVEDCDDSREQLSTSQESFDPKEKDWNAMIEEEENPLTEYFITYPKNTEQEFLCNINIINDTKTLELNVIHNDETNSIYEEMFHKLQTECPNMEQLQNIFENKACVALFVEDSQWYRTSILQYSESKNQIKVRYVDYGNVDIVSVADAREIKKDFAELPPTSIKAKLCDISINPEVDIKDLLQKYGEIFLDQGPFHAKVMGYDDSVPLVELRNDDNELVYDTLIQQGVFIFAKDVCD